MILRWLYRLLLLLALAAFSIWVWPTRYRYDHITSNGETSPVRINRFTGDADMLVPDECWVPVEGESGSGDAEQNQPAGGATRPS